jgi:hypothetical protein
MNGDLANAYSNAVYTPQASIASISIVSISSNSLGPPPFFSHRKPAMPDVSEPIRIAVFEPLTIFDSPPNAKFVMKIDIVKPIPPRSPAPKTCFQFQSSGRWQRPTLTTILVNIPEKAK